MDYKYLIFSGGGIKGISYCGALDVLESKGILKNIIGYAGTSSGAILASLLAVGYSAVELKQIMNDLNMADLIDDKFGYIRDGINIVESYGVAPGKYVNKLLGTLIKKKTGNKDYSINQLFHDKKIKLVIVGTNMNTGSSRYFYPDSPCIVDGNISIRKAVRISMSIPLIFEPVMHDNNIHVDGGVLDNFPLHVFDGPYPGEMNARLDLCKINKQVLGLRIITSESIDNYDKLKNIKINNLLEYGLSFISTFMAENNRRILTPTNMLRTISIITPIYSIYDFNVSSEDKQLLINAGYNSTLSFFDIK